MRVLVVDDEPPARSRLGRLVGELCPEADVTEATNGLDAIAQVEQSEPDVVLLDVRMPGMDGLEVARHIAALNTSPAVIFTTAFEAHALEAFDAEALDYLLKPVRRQRLERALARARTLRKSTRSLDAVREHTAFGARTHLNATQSGKLQLIPVADIRYLRAEHKYVEAATDANTYLVDESLASIETEFPDRFLRVHRGALVARAYVRALEREANGKSELALAGITKRIEVSRRMLPKVKDLFKSVV